jgi:hypothetical protein
MFYVVMRVIIWFYVCIYKITWILKGYDDSLSHSELLGFWTFSIVQYSRNYKTRRFGNWICFWPQVWVEGRTTQLGLLDRANLNHVMFSIS